MSEEKEEKKDIHGNTVVNFKLSDKRANEKKLAAKNRREFMRERMRDKPPSVG